MRILHYHKSVIGKDILFCDQGQLILCNLHLAIIGILCSLRDNLVLCKSKKQPMMARPSKKNFRAIAQATCELICVKH